MSSQDDMTDPYMPPPGFGGMPYAPEPPEPDAEGMVARSGEDKEDGAPLADEQAIVKSLQTVFDPEIPVNIHDLGLIYEIETMEKGKVHIVMTLTAPGCPVAGILPQQVADAAAAVDSVGEAAVKLVWDPMWEPDMMSDDAKLALGF